MNSSISCERREANQRRQGKPIQSMCAAGTAIRSARSAGHRQQQVAHAVDSTEHNDSRDTLQQTAGPEKQRGALQHEDVRTGNPFKVTRSTEKAFLFDFPEAGLPNVAASGRTLS